MSFSQQSISSVNPPVQLGTQLLLSWTSSAPAGTLFQVYVDRRLAWSGTGRSCSIALPTAISRIDIGTVAPGEAQTSFAAELPGSPARLATLSWLGGTFESVDIAGFHIYGEGFPGGGIDYTDLLATVPAYVAGIITPEFGYGGFGQSGFGESAGSYTWTSQPLSGGTWLWAVKPFDLAGNEGPAATTAVTIAAPPLPASPFPHMNRLSYVYHASAKVVTRARAAGTSVSPARTVPCLRRGKH
jgi:hypothetical protein